MQYKQNIWKGHPKYSIEQGVFKKITTFDYHLLFEEDLDNTDNGNEGDEDAGNSTIPSWTIAPRTIAP